MQQTAKDEILIGRRLAESLHIEINSTIILLSKVNL
jgi:ABC-type lipoprotein release transport system permease subunit